MRNEDLQIVKTLTGCSDEAILSVLLQEAEDRILGMTGRTRMITELYPSARELAVCNYNRLGSEGMSSRSDSEIGISSSFEDIPDTIKSQIYRYRLSRVGGVYYEANEAES